MSSTDPELLLVLEGCESHEDLAPFVLLIESGKFSQLKKTLNAQLNTDNGPRISQLLSQVEKGNVSELVDTDLFPLLMDAVTLIANQNQSSE